MFKEKVCWVIGASSGIGRETAIQLNGAGAVVILSARRMEKLKEVQDLLPYPDKSKLLELDLENQKPYLEMAKSLFEEFGSIDYLFNNGGLSQRSEVGDTEIEIDRRIMEINYFGNIALAKAVLPYMRKQQSGHIVVTSSIAGKFGFFLRSAYSASKHALQGFYESLMLEEEKNNIFVTMVYPGKINTDISISALKGGGETHGKMDHNQETGMSAEVCVQKLLAAVEKKKRSVLIGGKEIKAVTLKRFFPKLFWKVIRKQKHT